MAESSGPLAFLDSAAAQLLASYNSTAGDYDDAPTDEDDAGVEEPGFKSLNLAGHEEDDNGAEDDYTDEQEEPAEDLDASLKQAETMLEKIVAGAEQERALAAAADAGEEGEHLDGILDKLKFWKKKNHGKEAINADARAKKKRAEADIEEARAEKHRLQAERKQAKQRDPLPTSATAARLADMPGMRQRAPGSVAGLLSEAEVAFARTVDVIAVRGYALTPVREALMKRAASPAYYEATLAAASALAELCASSPAPAGLKATVDVASKARELVLPPAAAEKFAATMAAFGPALAGGEPAARGKALATHLRTTTTDQALPSVVAALADVVHLLQNRSTNGTLAADTDMRMKRFWAASGASAAALHAAVQQCFA